MFSVQPVLGIDRGCDLVCAGQLQPSLPGDAQRSGMDFHFSSRTSVLLLVPSVVSVVYTQKIIPTCKQLYKFLGSFLKG